MPWSTPTIRMADPTDTQMAARPHGRRSRPTVEGGLILRRGGVVTSAHLAGALLGAVTWVIAARTWPAADVGTAVALTGALTWAGLLANAGLGSTVMALTPGRPARQAAALATSAVRGAIALGAAAGAVLCAALVVGGGALGAAVGQPAVAAAMVVGAAATSATIVVDHVAIASDRAASVVRRQVAFGGARTSVVVATAAHADGVAPMVAGWAGASALALLVAVAEMRRAGALTEISSPGLAGATRLLRGGAVTHHLVNLGGQSPALLLPLVVVASAPPSEAAALAAAWQIVGLGAMLSPAVATSLFATGSREPGALDLRAKEVLTRLIPACALLGLGVTVVGPLLLDVLGSAYRSLGAVALVLLAAALIPDAITNVAIAVLRVRRRFPAAVALNAGMATLAVLGTAVLAPRLGATGAAAAWLLAQAVGAGAVAVAWTHARDRTVSVREAPS